MMYGPSRTSSPPSEPRSSLPTTRHWRNTRPTDTAKRLAPSSRARTPVSSSSPTRPKATTSRPHLLAQGEQVGFGAHLLENRASCVILSPGPVELVEQVGSDAGPRLGGVVEHGEHPRRRRVLTGGPTRTGHEGGGGQQRGEHLPSWVRHQIPFLHFGSSAARRRTASDPSASTGWAQAHRTGRRTPLVTISARRRTVPPSSARSKRNDAC